jgi:hypothetical protein
MASPAVHGFGVHINYLGKRISAINRSDEVVAVHCFSKAINASLPVTKPLKDTSECSRLASVSLPHRKTPQMALDRAQKIHVYRSL